MFQKQFAINLLTKGEKVKSNGNNQWIIESEEYRNAYDLMEKLDWIIPLRKDQDKATKIKYETGSYEDLTPKQKLDYHYSKMLSVLRFELTKLILTN